MNETDYQELNQKAVLSLEKRKSVYREGGEQRKNNDLIYISSGVVVIIIIGFVRTFSLVSSLC